MDLNLECHLPILNLKKWQISSYVSPKSKFEKFKQNRIIPEEICHNYNCSICLCDCYRGSRLILGKCGHIYHLQCFSCLNNSNFDEYFLCPICRTEWRNKALIIVV